MVSLGLALLRLPIPHTVLAKGAAATLPGLDSLPALMANQTVLFPWKGALRGLFLPTYVWFSDWPLGMQWWMHYAAWVAVFYCVVPGAHPVGRAGSLSFLLTSLYVTVAPRAPWYLPSHAVMAMVVLGAAVNDLAALGRRHHWAR
ncbi:MAG: hypothetical protein EXS42_07940 [Lacunisphaera sp.]|nr:hypothetical protein [Lacunisphaera sp.]